MSNM